MDKSSNSSAKPNEQNGHLLSDGDQGKLKKEIGMDIDDKEYKCGVGSCRPSALQYFANMKSFTFVLSMIHVFGNMNFTYYTAVITQIERQFGLSSSTTGFIKNIDNIGYITTVLIVSHFLRYANKPRIFSIATAASAVAIAIFAFPHFIYGVGEPTLNLNITQPKNRSKFELCELNPDEMVLNEGGCKSNILLMPFNAGALVFFIVSELLQGIAQSPKFTLSLTYMDDNAKKNSPLYFGIMFAMRSFAPVLGFMLGAWTTGMYVDLSDPGLSRRDPRWIGAWWLGFIICALCTIIWAPLLALFPARFAEEKDLTDKEKLERDQEASNKNQLKDLPAGLLRIVTNPVFIFMVLASCFNFYLMGFSTFTPKYLENQFGMTSSEASIMTGIISACSYSLGPIVSGKIMTGKKITTTGALKFIMVINCVSAVGFTIMGFLGCPETEWAGDIDVEGNSLNATCNHDCNCDPFMFTPVCGSDGRNHFSPCYAGCLQSMSVMMEGGHTVFNNCTCTGELMKATEGLCQKSCLYVMIPYVIIMIISKFSASMTIVPYLTVLMRCVGYKDKALGLAVSATVMQIASFPAPIVFGAIIDSTCRFQQSSCTRRGACLLYDMDEFRIRLHGLAAFVKTGAVCMYLLAWLFVRRMEKNENKDGNEDEKTTNDSGDKVKDAEKQPLNTEKALVVNGDVLDNNNITVRESDILSTEDEPLRESII